MVRQVRQVRLAVLALLLLAPPALAASATDAAALAGGAYCGITWGSLQQAVGAGPGLPPSSPIDAVRTGRHRCYDRMVIELQGAPGGYRVGYVPAVAHQAKDETVPLRGGAFLQVVLFAPVYDEQGNVTVNVNALPGVRGYRTFRQLGSGGSFEGYTTIGLGVRARLPFRVFTLAGPGSGSRLVIDVAHRW